MNHFTAVCELQTESLKLSGQAVVRHSTPIRERGLAAVAIAGMPKCSFLSVVLADPATIT